MGPGRLLSIFGVAAMLALTACGEGETPEPPAGETESEAAFGAIDRDRLLNADQEPENWLTTGRDFGKSHHSPLDSINRDNVDRLGLAWEYRTQTTRGLEATPIVVDGVMYTSGPWGQVYALDAQTGEEIWYFHPKVDGQAARNACCGIINRGVAVWEGKVFVATLDGRLYALDAETGDVIWDVQTIEDKTRAYAVTGAPEVAGDVVVIGNAGAEYDARGYITAYDLETGEFAWRFFTVPGGPEPPFEHPSLEKAAETWDPDSRWDVGLGGTVWDAMVYDPELDLLYIGTGNPALYNQEERSPSGGDNLFTCSILAIDPKTGELVWHFQEVPGDQWDFDSNEPMILADLEIEGETRKVLLHAPKNGFFYVLDRETGEFISAENYVPQNWAEEIDPETGRAIVDKEAVHYAEGLKLVFPSPAGGHNWNRMAFSQDTGLVYIPAIEMGMYTIDSSEGHEYRPGQVNVGVSGLMTGGSPFVGGLPPEAQAIVKKGTLTEDSPDPTARGFLRAWDPVAQKTVWEVETAGWWDRAGVLATAGGLVFQGTATGHFRVYDAATGEMLKDIDVGTTIIAAPVTFAVDGTQYVAVMAAGGGIPLSKAPDPETAMVKYGNDGRILAFRLDGGPVPKPEPVERGPIPEPPPLKTSPETVARGEALFGANCTNCHTQAPAAEAPDLRRMTPAAHENFSEIVLQGTRRPLGMPQWDDILDEDDVAALHAYVISMSHAAYDGQEAE